MAYNDQVTRANVQALIPEDVSRQIIDSAPQMSAIMGMAARMPNMTTNQQRIPVLSLLPHGYFVSGDTGLKQTSNVAWENKYFNAEEIAVIVPIAQAVLDDLNYNLWDNIRPRIEAEMGKVFDQAVLFGTNAPTSWPSSLLVGCTAASHKVVLGTGLDMYTDVLGVSGLYDLVNSDGFNVTGALAALSVRAKLRDIRDGNGVPLFNRIPIQDATRYELDGVPLTFPLNGAMDASQALMIVGDYRQLLWTIREDITYRVFTEGVVTDGTGAVVYNLMQQDMVALRVVFRVAWQLPNPVNMVNSSSVTRYPFAVLTAT